MSKNFEVLKNKYEKSIFLNEKLSKFSWFNLGGPAQVLFRPKSEKELSNFLKKEKNHFRSVNILGAGSNTLIRDGGIPDLTIKLSSKFSYIKLINENSLEVGGATLDKKISDFAYENCIKGFEFLSCIPGSLGGAIVMNSGCYNDEISKLIKSIKVIDFNGNTKIINKNDIKFYYRGTSLQKDCVIISAILKGEKEKKEIIFRKREEMINRKKISQPSKVKTCGSTFKNPPNEKAWNLIKKSNCDSLSVGKAKVSTKHSNFLINEGTEKSSDIEKLIMKVRTEVFKKTGIDLELEIKIIGEK